MEACITVKAWGPPLHVGSRMDGVLHARHAGHSAASATPRRRFMMLPRGARQDPETDHGAGVRDPQESWNIPAGDRKS